MVSSTKILISLSFVFIVFNCNKTTGPILPDITTTEATLKNLQIDIISSDSLIIRNGDSLLVNAMDVVKISVFEEHEDSLIFLISTLPSYRNVGSLLRLEFLLPIKVLYPDYDKTFVLQFNMSDDTILEVKTYAHVYKYPYENVERWFRFTDIGSINPYGEAGWLCAPQFTLDFEINNGNFYFIAGACGVWGVSKYNFNSRESEYVSNIIWEPEDNGRGPINKPRYAGGIHFAVDGDYLFCDQSSHIIRINLLTDTTSLFIYEGFYQIMGIEAFNDSLFFIEKRSRLTDNFDLKICTYSGSLLNSIQLPQSNVDFGPYYRNLESYKGVLYIWCSEKILRLNLNDLTFLTPLVAPQNGNNGFDIYDDILYYAYDDIYWIELSELREVE